jgi:hypothetical protein
MVNPNSRQIITCPVCKLQKPTHAKGMCYPCYKKQWKSQDIICKECGRKRPHKAFGLCGSCHTRLHHYKYVKNYNIKKYHDLSPEVYRKIVEKCVCCSFSKIVELHHLDGDSENKDKMNMIGLCPNCHKMIHTFEFYKEIKAKLKEKGYEVSKVHPSNYTYRKDEKNEEID